MSADLPIEPARLRQLALFEGLDEHALQAIAERVQLLALASGDDLFCAGDVADAL